MKTFDVLDMILKITNLKSQLHIQGAIRSGDYA